MVRIADWVNLADSTLRGVQARDVKNLYALEWPETIRTLTSEHRQALENRSRIPRFFHTASALIYGLARRLAPQRRLIFALALILALYTAVETVSDANSLSLTTMAGLLLPSVLFVLLLAMELIDKIRFRDELELARDLQKGLLPEELPKLPRVQLAAFNRIANTVGGDIYDFVPLSDGRLAVLFGDASGHGMTAGLVMAVAHAAFRTQLDIDPEPDAIIGALNRTLCRTGGRRSFFTCCYVLIEEDGRFRCCVAGHPPILHLSAGGEITRSIGNGSYPLGIRSSLAWTIHESRLEDGESLLFYSDGLVEARNAAGEEYGYERAERVAATALATEADGMLRTLLADWEVFTQGLPIDDDVSVAVIRRNPECRIQNVPPRVNSEF